MSLLDKRSVVKMLKENFSIHKNLLVGACSIFQGSHELRNIGDADKLHRYKKKWQQGKSFGRHYLWALLSAEGHASLVRSNFLQNCDPAKN